MKKILYIVLGLLLIIGCAQTQNSLPTEAEPTIIKQNSNVALIGKLYYVEPSEHPGYWALELKENIIWDCGKGTKGLCSSQTLNVLGNINEEFKDKTVRVSGRYYIIEDIVLTSGDIRGPTIDVENMQLI